VAIIDRVRAVTGVSNLRLLFDLYHLTVNGEDVSAAITDFGDRVAHVQIADAPPAAVSVVCSAAPTSVTLPALTGRPDGRTVLASGF